MERSHAMHATRQRNAKPTSVSASEGSGCQKAEQSRRVDTLTDHDCKLHKAAEANRCRCNEMGWSNVSGSGIRLPGQMCASQTHSGWRHNPRCCASMGGQHRRRCDRLVSVNGMGTLPAHAAGKHKHIGGML